MSRKYDVKRVNRFNLALMLIFSFVLTLQAFLLSGSERGVLVLITTGSASVAAILIVLLRIPQKLASVLLPMCPLISGLVLMIFAGGSPKAIIVLIVTFTMAGLYFEKNILIIFGLVSNVVFIVLNLVLGLDVIGKDQAVNEILTQLIMADSALVVLYFMSKWGNEYVYSAFASQEKASELLSNLEEIMKNIEIMTENMSEDLSHFRVNIETNKKASNEVLIGMNEIASGVEEEAIAVSQIAETMKGIQEKINYTNDLSSEVEKLSKDVNVVAQNNGQEIEVMNSSMKTIETSVNENLSTVKELGVSMDEISGFLSAITGIADQTNLLALNASIEAARAGEAGRGFTVVAEEIRKLSEESRNVANEIGEIINNLRDKTEKVLGISQQGTLAVVEGDEILKSLKEGINGMVLSFDSMQKYINEEHNSLNDITKLFYKVQENLESNSAIMEEQAATTQVISSAVETQDKGMIEMVETIKNIERLGMELKNLAKR